MNIDLLPSSSTLDSVEPHLNTVDSKAVDIWSLAGTSTNEPQRAILFQGSQSQRLLSQIGDIPVHSYAKVGKIDFEDLFCIRICNATIRGVDVIYIKGKPMFYAGCHPPYAVTMFPFDDDRITGAKSKKTIEVSWPLVSLCHWTSFSYGHFLLEMLPKIVGFYSLKVIYPNMKIVMSSLAGDKIISIVRQFVSKNDLYVFDGNTQVIHVSSLFLLPSLFIDWAFHPMMDSFLVLAKSKAKKLSKHFFSDKIYVSKSRLRESGRSDYRHLKNEVDVKNFLENRGFITIFPEKISWLEQVALFSSVKTIVGEYTSAFHNAIFAPAGTLTIGLNYVNEVQDCIAAYARHKIGYVMPNDGIARMYNNPSQNPEFEIDLMDLDKLLALAPN